jgi:uncharacterized DUF497 family protein
MYNVSDPYLRFEWDKRKNAINRKKHRISFQEAMSVFVDENALLLTDPDHSGTEDRFLLLGLSSTLRLVVVAHCYRSSDEVIRIISARRATRRERAQYHQRWAP